jgi:hypothetical protein
MTPRRDPKAPENLLFSRGAFFSWKSPSSFTSFAITSFSFNALTSNIFLAIADHVVLDRLPREAKRIYNPHTQPLNLIGPQQHCHCHAV